MQRINVYGRLAGQLWSLKCAAVNYAPPPLTAPPRQPCSSGAVARSDLELCQPNRPISRDCLPARTFGLGSALGSERGRRYYRHRRRRPNEDDDSGSGHQYYYSFNGRYYFASVGIGMGGLYGHWTVFKHWMGIEKLPLDDNPITAKVKESIVLRKYGKRKEASETLHTALQLAQEAKDDLAITAVMDHLALCYLELGDLELAKKNYMDVLSRLVNIHGKPPNDKDFIAVSVVLADIFAQQGDLVKAEAGFRHCIDQQEKVVNEHQTHYLREKGALAPVGDPMMTLGAEYTTPLALYGMCLELYAHFLLGVRTEDRSAEAVELMHTAVSIAYEMYGGLSEHLVNMLNNFAVKCIWAARFDLARTYMADVIAKAVHMPEFGARLPGFYCNYAEALFHCGDRRTALDYADRAVALARETEDRQLVDYANAFAAELRADADAKPRRRPRTART